LNLDGHAEHRSKTTESMKVVDSSKPPTIYAKSGELHIAYQVLGEGPIDLVYVQGTFTNLSVNWELAAFQRFCRQLSEFTRLIWFDKRGMGLSDRVQVGTLDERMDDVRAVMDAAGSSTAVLMGESEGGPLSLLFAAAHPERTSGLILAGAEVKERISEDWPWGESTVEDFEAAMRQLPDTWGGSGFLDHIAPSHATDSFARDWASRLLLNSATPGVAESFMRMAFDIDVRAIVPIVATPTLILHRKGDLVCSVENARYLAQHISGAKCVELEGSDHVPWSGGDDMLDEIREFITGAREATQSDRILVTLLFTDLVGSTSLAATMGDESWRSSLDAHDLAIRNQIRRFHGREVNTTGDGFFIAFDGPARAIRCAQAIREAIAIRGLGVRCGLHTGECEMRGDDLAGLAVHIAARVAAEARSGEILVSRTVTDLVAGSGIEFTERGEFDLKGVPGTWRLFAVAS
jgi:class 3 adenylate cyclase